MATIVSFRSQRIQTSANTTVSPAYIVGARLLSTTTASVIVHLHDTTGTTSAATRVATLQTTAKGIDETRFPVRVMSGTCIVSPVVAAGATVATLYVFVR